MLAGRVQRPCAPAPQLGLDCSSKAFQVSRGLRSTPLAHLGVLAAQEGGKFGAAGGGAGSPWPQHQQRVASKAGPRLGHLPTGRGLRGSGRSGSGARISGSGGLCCWARGSASSGVGGGEGTAVGSGGGGRNRVPRRSQGRRQERRGALLRGPQVPDLPGAATAGMLEASPRCLQRRPPSGTGRAPGGRRGAAVARRPPGARL